MKFSLAFTLAFLASSANAEVPSLTPDNYDEMTAGKTVFLKFFAPWCGYCKRMAPDWEQLAEEYKDSKFGLVAEVDCTAEGQPLCEANGVGGYPTIMYGDPSDLEKYQGGRSYEELKDFAEEYIIPFCSPANMELCDDEQKAEIIKFQAMPDEELVKAIEEKEAEIEKAESQFEEYAEEINNKYDQAWEAKEATIEAIKASGLKLMKVVKAQKEVQVGSDEL